MANTKFKIGLMALFALGIALTSCGNKSDNASKTEQAEKHGKEFTSAYVCPMHCDGSGSAEEGKCPVCGMNYVALSEHKSDGHHHDKEPHEGHDHDDHSNHNHN